VSKHRYNVRIRAQVDSSRASLAKAREPVERLHRVIDTSVAENRRLEALQIEHKALLGEAMAAGEPDPEPSHELTRARDAAALAAKRAEIAAGAWLGNAQTSGWRQFPASWEDTGKFIDSDLRHPDFLSKTRVRSATYTSDSLRCGAGK
jgi:hypothetical protein